MKQDEVKVNFRERIDFRDEASRSFPTLNSLGTRGWSLIHIHNDVRSRPSIAVFLERERA